MEIEGIIAKVMELRSGTSQRGNWMSQEYVLRIPANREGFEDEMMVFSVFGEDRIKRFSIQEGQKVNVSCHFNGREYNGRWYNDIRAFDVRQRMDAPMTAQGVAEPSMAQGAGAQGVAEPSMAQGADAQAANAAGTVDPLNPFGGAPTDELPFG